MSRLISDQLGQSADRDCGRDVARHGNHLPAPSSGPAVEQSLTHAKNSLNFSQSQTCSALIPGVLPVERQQNRPSVITCAPSSNRNHSLALQGPSPPDPCPAVDSRPTSMIDEHFRRSLGRSYRDAESSGNSVSISGSVDEHFAKALGETWQHIKAKGGTSGSAESAL
ncbi:hypothetical protein AGOR_G00132500 [Albula goreensis]|uniref:Transcription cofactor vestigial-like protein 4 n=1 Tax=Albula goreensis TaxID=1534307 RepID=A0A8T3D9I4_9TELE|nr:hypothetical protein AGOR_G00132500 [Albula goreensis]